MAYAILFGFFVGLAFANFWLMPVLPAVLLFPVCLLLARLSLKRMGQAMDQRTLSYWKG